MTNRKKFKEVFGFTPKEDCIAPTVICHVHNNMCNKCPFRNWWDRDYLKCFRLREDLKE